MWLLVYFPLGISSLSTSAYSLGISAFKYTIIHLTSIYSLDTSTHISLILVLKSVLVQTLHINDNKIVTQMNKIYTIS